MCIISRSETFGLVYCFLILGILYGEEDDLAGPAQRYSVTEKKVHAQLNSCSVLVANEIFHMGYFIYIIFRIKVPDSLPQEFIGWIPKKVLILLGSLLL